MKFHFHKWKEVEVKNSGRNFLSYIEGIFKQQIFDDFKGLLRSDEMRFPNCGDFSWEEDNLFANETHYIYPKVWVCLKCFQYKTDLNSYKDRLKKIYTRLYEENMSKYINKEKKIKLTIDGIEEQNESTIKLDSLNVLLKQFNNINERENKLLKDIKLF